MNTRRCLNWLMILIAGLGVVVTQAGRAGAAATPVAPDLGVRFISRSPLYWRYNVAYAEDGRLPFLAPTHNNQDPALDQHWPAPGEQVTFTAHVRNHGTASAKSFQYRWYIDDQPQSAQPLVYAAAVAPGSEAVVQVQWTWPANLDDHTIRIVVDPNQLLPDPYPQNNSYTDYTNALSFSIWVEQGLYERFNARQNGFGTRSFDDWFRWQFDAMKANFARSVYPDTAPNGILERIRVEEINVIPFDPNNLDNWRAVLNQDPHLLRNDGRWQFTSDRQTLAEKQADWDSYVDQFANRTDWGLIHELAHQLGVIDEYRLNVDDPLTNLVLEKDGQPLHARHAFHRPGLMGGGYVLPGYDETYFDGHTAGFLNRNLHSRRGYYGEFLFDTPEENWLQALDIRGRPLANATVTLYQKDPDEVLRNVPVITGVTDASGRFRLPNRPTSTVTTATGHTLRPNPFGYLHVVGINGTMLIKFARGGQEDFRWLEIIQLNEAYWRGNTEVATYTFSTHLDLDAGPLGTTNVALHRPATASVQPTTAQRANDGDLTTPDQTWAPDPPLAGQWWQVDLGSVRALGRAVVYPHTVNAADWYHRFHFEVSPTGAFQGEQTVIPAEADWISAVANGDFELQRRTGLQNRVVYTFPAAQGRYFRVVSDVTQSWVQLQELQLFEYEPTGPTGPAGPSGLTATAVSTTGIALSWRDHAGDEQGFRLERSADGGATWPTALDVPAQSGTGATVSYTDTGLVADTHYLYRVRAWNGSGDSAYSNEVGESTLPERPGAPSELAATATSATQISLTWWAGSGRVDSYEVERRTGATAFAKIGTASASGYQDAGLAANSEYVYRVRAVNRAGYGEYSNESRVTTQRQAGGKLVVGRKLAFGQVKPGRTKTLPLTLRNASRTEELQVTVGTLAEPFGVTGGGSVTLGPGSSRTLTVRFSPQRPGRASGMLTITSSDPAHRTLIVTLSGRQ